MKVQRMTIIRENMIKINKVLQSIDKEGRIVTWILMYQPYKYVIHSSVVQILNVHEKIDGLHVLEICVPNEENNELSS